MFIDLPKVAPQQPDPVGHPLHATLPRPAPRWESLAGRESTSNVPAVPLLWKFGMVVLIACLLASMAIAIVRLATTPTEILGDGFRGSPVQRAQR